MKRALSTLALVVALGAPASAQLVVELPFDAGVPERVIVSKYWITTAPGRPPPVVTPRAHSAPASTPEPTRDGAEECGFARNSVWLMSEKRPDLRGLRAWLKQKKPDVIVTNLHGVFEELLRELGRAVPQDIGLVSLSAPAIGDRVSGIDQNSYLIGTRAIDLLAGALQLHQTGLLPETITTLVNGRWNPGETL